MNERNRWISQRSAAEYHKTPNIYRVSFLFPLLPPPCKGGVNPRGAHKVVPLLIGVSRGEKFSILIAVYAHACAYGHRRSRHGQLNIHYCGCRLRPRNTSRTSKRNRRVACPGPTGLGTCTQPRSSPAAEFQVANCYSGHRSYETNLRRPQPSPTLCR